jgi:hypothetical protein
VRWGCGGRGTAYRCPPDAQIVLATLIAQRDQTVATERLIRNCWGDSPPVSASTQIHAFISTLRRLFGLARTGLPDGLPALLTTPLSFLVGIRRAGLAKPSWRRHQTGRALGAGGVVFAAGPDGGDPQRPPVGVGEHLQVAAVVLVLAGPPQVRAVRAGCGAPVDTDHGAVQIQGGVACGFGCGDGLGQARAAATRLVILWRRSAGSTPPIGERLAYAACASSLPH